VLVQKDRGNFTYFDSQCGVCLFTCPHRAALRRIKEISAVINVWMNRDVGEGVLQKEVLCNVVESVAIVDLRKSHRQ
jgi:hypothetical protein